MKYLVLFTILAALSFNALGQESFYRVYQYETPLLGRADLNLWNTAIGRSDLPYDHFDSNGDRTGLFAHSIEFEYGLLNHLSLGAYSAFENTSATGFNFTGIRLESTYRFFERFDKFVNTAVYFEYYFPSHAYSSSQEAEFRLILDKDIEDFRLALNPTLRKYTTGDEDKKLQPGLDAGLYFRRFYVLQPGIEYYGNFSEGSSQLFPHLAVHIGPHLTWDLGAGFGLNDKSDKFTFTSILQCDLQVVRPSRLLHRSKP